MNLSDLAGLEVPDPSKIPKREESFVVVEDLTPRDTSPDKVVSKGPPTPPPLPTAQNNVKKVFLPKQIVHSEPKKESPPPDHKKLEMSRLPRKPTPPLKTIALPPSIVQMQTQNPKIPIHHLLAPVLDPTGFSFVNIKPPTNPMYAPTWKTEVESFPKDCPKERFMEDRAPSYFVYSTNALNGKPKLKPDLKVPEPIITNPLAILLAQYFDRLELIQDQTRQNGRVIRLAFDGRQSTPREAIVKNQKFTLHYSCKVPCNFDFYFSCVDGENKTCRFSTQVDFSETYTNFNIDIQPGSMVGSRRMFLQDIGHKLDFTGVVSMKRGDVSNDLNAKPLVYMSEKFRIISRLDKFPQIKKRKFDAAFKPQIQPPDGSTGTKLLPKQIQEDQIKPKEEDTYKVIELSRRQTNGTIFKSLEIERESK
jgi:hypothetical protein